VLNFSVTFFITIVNITFLYLVLRKVLFGRVTKFMAARTERIQQDINQAKFSNDRAKALEEEWTVKLEGFREEGQRILQLNREKAAKERAAVLEAAKVEAARLIAAAREEIALERREAERELLGYAADLTIEAATAVLGETVDSERNRALVAKFLDSTGVA